VTPNDSYFRKNAALCARALTGSPAIFPERLVKLYEPKTRFLHRARSLPSMYRLRPYLQPDQAEGSWESLAFAGGNNLRRILRQGNKTSLAPGRELSSRVLKARGILFVSRRDRMRLTYQGRVSADYTTIAGSWMQGGSLGRGRGKSASCV
jgi:hypothetical protein